MRRILLVVTLGLGVVLAVPVAAVAQGPSEDSVKGTGTDVFFGAFDIDVSSGPSGENPTGQASFQSAVGPLTGPVSCLEVHDNVATFNITGTSYGLITFEVTDNTGATDVIEGIPTIRAASDCSPVVGAVQGSVLSGDLVVVDTRAGQTRINTPCKQTRGRVSFTSPQCRRTVPG